jgi:enoyl-CoA hydratase/carnithine racemase
MSDQIKSAIENSILLLTIARPEKKNALTADMYEAMADSITDADNNKNIRVILITGSEDSFTAGNDLKDFLDNPPIESSSPVFQFMHAIAGTKKPVVAAVNGLAIGIGTTMLLHCDLVYAVETARFQLPFVNLGLVPELGSSLILPALTGRTAAAELMMFGDMFNTAKATEIGLLNGTCSAETLLGTARSAAQKLATKPPAALRKTKALLNSNVNEVHARIDQEAQVFGEQLNSVEVKEAIAAFFEKRAPDFSKFE